MKGNETNPARCSPRFTSSFCMKTFHTRCVRRSEEHTSELQSPCNLVCRLLLEKKKKDTHRQLSIDLRRRSDVNYSRPTSSYDPLSTLELISHTCAIRTTLTSLPLDTRQRRLYA